jgi:hypothetical protein
MRRHTTCAKSEMHGSDARMRGDTCHNSSSSTRVARTSTIQTRAGKAGTTGTDPENQRLTVPKTSLEIGNDGNDSKRPPLVLLDGYLRAALQRPPSWADPTQDAPDCRTERSRADENILISFSSEIGCVRGAAGSHMRGPIQRHIQVHRVVDGIRDRRPQHGVRH